MSFEWVKDLKAFESSLGGMVKDIVEHICKAKLLQDFYINDTITKTERHEKTC